jgi:hypothetical protein
MGNSGGRDPVVALSSLTPSAAPPPALAVPAEPASVITVDLRHIGAEPAVIEDEQRHQLLSPDAKVRKGMIGNMNSLSLTLSLSLSLSLFPSSTSLFAY